MMIGGYAPGSLRARGVAGLAAVLRVDDDVLLDHVPYLLLAPSARARCPSMSVRMPARSTSLTHAYFMKSSRTRLPAVMDALRCSRPTARFTVRVRRVARMAERLREIEHAEAQVVDAGTCAIRSAAASAGGRSRSSCTPRPHRCTPPCRPRDRRRSPSTPAGRRRTSARPSARSRRRRSRAAHRRATRRAARRCRARRGRGSA